MKHKVSRLACGLLAAVLILGTTACAGKPGKRREREIQGRSRREPDRRAGKDRQNSRSRFPRPARTARETKTGCGPDQTQYNDSLITDAYAAAGEAATEWGGSYSYEVRIPELLCDSRDAAALNAEIMDIYGEEAKRAPRLTRSNTPLAGRATGMEVF